MSKYTVADASAAEKNNLSGPCPYCFAENNRINVNLLGIGATMLWAWFPEHEKHKEASQ